MQRRLKRSQKRSLSQVSKYNRPKTRPSQNTSPISRTIKTHSKSNSTSPKSSIKTENQLNLSSAQSAHTSSAKTWSDAWTPPRRLIVRQSSVSPASVRGRRRASSALGVKGCSRSRGFHASSFMRWSNQPSTVTWKTKAVTRRSLTRVTRSISRKTALEPKDSISNVHSVINTWAAKLTTQARFYRCISSLYATTSKSNPPFVKRRRPMRKRVEKERNKNRSSRPKCELEIRIYMTLK